MRVMRKSRRCSVAGAFSAVVAAMPFMTGQPVASASDPFAAMNVQPAVREVQAPTFRLRTPDGRPLALEELRGKVVAFYYWRTW